jgi:hypothetical protein
MITGLMIDGKGNVSIPQRKREEIRAMIHNACHAPFNPDLDKKIEGMIAYVKSVYGKEIPLRILKPYERYRKTRNLQQLALANDSLGPIIV